MAHDLEDVTRADGLPAVEAARDFVFAFLMLDVVKKTLFASTVPAASHLYPTSVN